MGVLGTTIDPSSASYAENRAAMLERLAELDSALEAARCGGGEKYVTRHQARGKLLPRERVELLVDQDSPVLELSPVAAWGTDYPVGASVVTAIGVVCGVECVIVANDPTVRGGVVNPYTLAKIRRAGEIALANRLPTINLVESAGTDLPAQSDTFIPGGAVVRDLAKLSAARIPTISVVFGNATAAGAYLPGLSEYTIMVRNQARVLVVEPDAAAAATGESGGEGLGGESLGGATVHASRTGLADFLAEDDRDGIRLARLCVRRLNWRKLGAPPRNSTPPPPRHDQQDLLSIPCIDPLSPFDPREVLARILDGSEFDEFKPGYGGTLVTGWGELHGYPIGVLANTGGPLHSAEAQKATHFIQLANATDTPLLFLQNTTGYLAGADQEQRGIIKYGAQMINAVANSTVPHLTVAIGASYGTGNYGMCGRAFQPRFLFTWPNARAAVMGAAQLTGLLSVTTGLVPGAGGPAARTASNTGQDAATDAAAQQLVEQRIEATSAALFLSGKLYDDGVIDPRDTRSVLGLCLSAIHSGPVGGTGGFGVFRM